MFIYKLKKKNSNTYIIKENIYRFVNSMSQNLNKSIITTGSKAPMISRLFNRKLPEFVPHDNHKEEVMSSIINASPKENKLETTVDIKNKVNDNNFDNENDTDNEKKVIKKRKGGEKKKRVVLTYEDDEEEESIIIKSKLNSKNKKKKFKVSLKGDSSIDISFIKTKQEIRKEEKLREQIRQEYLLKQEEIKKKQIKIPFVYYDGVSTPSKLDIKFGDQIWIFLENARKIKKEFHRLTVDDIILVKDNIIIPHNYEFYYFIHHKIKTKKGLLFDFNNIDASQISSTKVVQRSWYERNKHIYPVSLWTEFDPEEDYVNRVERDGNGNVLFNQDI